ncbi:restriction endonuclease [bacterium]|nr:restriction endonuclease [bacterium]
MNEWVERSIKLANAPGYLDKLHEVYPVDIEEKRQLKEGLEQEISEALSSGDDEKLMAILLKQKKFSLKDPYVGFLKQDPSAIKNNPQTIKRIVSRIKKQGLSGILSGITEEKEANRKMGQRFHRWLPTLGYPFLDEKALEKTSAIAFLDGGESKLKTFAEGKFGIKLEKKPDFLAKARNTYIIGEAKFLSSQGGSQNNDCRDALKLPKGRLGIALGVAVLDGVMWIPSNYVMFREVSTLGGVALSALLLKDFLESLAK